MYHSVYISVPLEEESKMLNVGEPAKDFELMDSDGKVHRLSDYLGQRVVLYFYPKDNTSGCTNQALEFKRLYEEFKKENTVIIGISKDSVKSHRNFRDKYELPFILLSDESTKVLDMYDVYQEKSMYGRKYMGVVRTTYVIDESGIIISVQSKVSSSTNAEDTLCLIRK